MYTTVLRMCLDVPNLEFTCINAHVDGAKSKSSTARDIHSLNTLAQFPSRLFNLILRTYYSLGTVFLLNLCPQLEIFVFIVDKSFSMTECLQNKSLI